MAASPSRRRTVLRWVAGGALAGVAVVAVAAIAYLPSENDVRRRLERTLSARLDADVSLAELHVSLVPRLRVEGAGLRLTPRNRRNAPPLIVVSRFAARAAWRDIFLRPRRVTDVVIEGMRITIAPKAGDTGIRERERGGCQGDRREAEQARQAEASASRRGSPVLIERLSAPGTEIELLPRDPAKLPRRFSIASLDLRRVTLDRPLEFDAVLTNPTPRGLIKAHGQFGPWAAGDPGLSPVEGRYVFQRANLDTIKGIGGMLESSGRFAGVLQQILVSGSTETPDFSLDTGNRPLPLHTDFSACVDGTDGDTYLDEVRARLASTPILVKKGKVEGKVGVDGRTVALDATIDGGRIEEVLALVIGDARDPARGTENEKPPMTGKLSLTTALLLPPGSERVVRRLQLNGRFVLDDARFTGSTVQAKVDELSRRARGRPQDAGTRNVGSDFAGRFVLAGGVLRLQELRFAVPGARVALHGTYGLVDQRLAMEGTARLEAKPSQMTSGIKSKLLKAADLLLSRKNAGTVLPITITGTRSHPDFGVDMKGVITRKVK